jgi:hypothetical protein
LGVKWGTLKFLFPQNWGLGGIKTLLGNLIRLYTVALARGDGEAGRGKLYATLQRNGIDYIATVSVINCQADYSYLIENLMGTMDTYIKIYRHGQQHHWKLLTKITAKFMLIT